MSRVLLALVGDANDPATWSGTAFHCLESGRALGTIDAGLPLETTSGAWIWRRRLWNLARLLSRFEKGGYQYSEAFLERLWMRAVLARDDTLINMFQLYPARLFARHPGEKWFYIDQTLNQLFNCYGVADLIGPRIAADALARERDQYAASAGVVAQSAWAARDLMETYGLPPARVHVAVAGANIDREALAAWEAERTHAPIPPERPLRLVFVGKEWRRKGLDRLIRAVTLARLDGTSVELTVIGVLPSQLPPDLAGADGITWAGFIDKRSDLQSFLDTVADCDVGCLLSQAEAGGISLREFCRLGLPTIAPAIGGSPEYVYKPAADLVAPDAPDEEIAAIISRLARDRDELERRRRLAFEARHLASWDTAVARLGALVGRDTRVPDERGRA